MVIRRFRLLALAIIALLQGVIAHAGEIDEITVAGDTEYTRITFAADSPLDHQAFLMFNEGERAIDVELGHTDVSLRAKTPPPTGGVAFYEIRGGQVLFHLTTPMMVSRALSLSPTTSEPRFRLVIDLVRVAPVRFDKAAQRDAGKRAAYLASLAGSAPDGRAAGSIVGVKPEKYVVVIDPGHGGKDPGASSHNQVREKSLVLQTSLALKTALERSGRYDVRLTRETDIYVEHEDRVSLARKWGADLFISIHADAAGNSDVSGATVYTLSARGERRVDGTAKSNGWDLPIEDGTPMEVSGILADLIKRETKSNSSIFAELLIPELSKAGPIVRNSHRRENFFVLLAPDVPAALVEIGFLTNRADVARLNSASGREKTAQAIARGIDAYFDQRDLLYAAN